MVSKQRVLKCEGMYLYRFVSGAILEDVVVIWKCKYFWVEIEKLVLFIGRMEHGGI